jgi:diacylglycerol O-acyltransferase
MGEAYAGPMEGSDVMMLHFEGPNTAFHFLNGAILDTTARGRPVSLDEVVAIAPTYLGISPRLTQRVEKRRRRWHWTDDLDFDVRNHVEERTVVGHDGFDKLCGDLAGEHLDRSRPLWKLTLVHGLPDGRQAAVVRMHHAIMDGSAAMNSFRALTSAASGTLPPIAVRTTPIKSSRPALALRLAGVARLAVKQRAKTKEFAPDESIPRSMMPRTWLNPKVNVPGRICAGTSVPLADLQELGRLIDSNVMGAFHAALAQTLRAYLLEKDALPDHRMVANFGVVENKDDPRCDGNRLATARVWMPVDVDDALELARLTARSCRESIALRRHRGMELQRDTAEFARIVPVLTKRFANVLWATPVHVQTAYVVGPAESRWFGEVAAVGWTSYAISVAPADFSITATRYGDRMWVGLVITLAAMPDPEHFLELFEQQLDHLLELARRPSADAPAGEVLPQLSS